jgi:hypothetical protein
MQYLSTTDMSFTLHVNVNKYYVKDKAMWSARLQRVQDVETTRTEWNTQASSQTRRPKY